MNITFVAIAISLFSLVVAATSLGWNIYRDIVLKARVRVSFGIRTIVSAGSDERPEYLILSVTNLGPGTVTLSMMQLQLSNLWRRILRKCKHAIVLHDYTNPLSGRLPKKLEVGEGIDLLLAYDLTCHLSEDWSRIGISDTFGRVHWAPRKQMREARESFLEAFKPAA